MKSIEKSLSVRGASRVLYIRVRIPSELAGAYPTKQQTVQYSLETSDLTEGKRRHAIELGRIYEAFAQKKSELVAREVKRAQRSSQRLKVLSDAQVQSFASHFVHQSLLTDDLVRSRGLDDEECDELDASLAQQRLELGKMLRRGQVERILPAMHSFLHLMGVEVELSEENERAAGHKFLQAVVEALDLRISRNGGNAVTAESRAPAVDLVTAAAALVPAASSAAGSSQAGTGPTWIEMLVDWRDHVKGRPKSTFVATQTPWRDLERFAASRGVNAPSGVTPELVRDFVSEMAARGLAVDTINDRLGKVNKLFKMALSLVKLTVNPARDTLGRGKSSQQKRQKKRFSFDQTDIAKIFGSSVYDGRHERSEGQSGEATYWIPMLMYYTGARTEELGGLALTDLVHNADTGWHINLIDRPEPEDADLFPDDDTPRRTLKNGASVRRVPLPHELIDLGLLRYVEWVRAQGHQAMFPTLKKDWHGKYTGAFSKFFGRFKVVVGINDRKKVLYSFRHNYKDTLELASVPSKYLKRLMGHTSGDGSVTDGYGSDMPFEVLVQHFRTVKFDPIPALPWQPGRGTVKMPHLKAKKVAVSGAT